MVTLSDKRVPSESRTAVPAALWVLPCTKRQGKRLYQSLNKHHRNHVKKHALASTRARLAMLWHSLSGISWGLFRTEKLFLYKMSHQEVGSAMQDLEQAFSKENDSLCAVGLPIFCPKPMEVPRSKNIQNRTLRLLWWFHICQVDDTSTKCPPSSMVQSQLLTDLNKTGPSRVIQTTSPARWWVEWKKKDWEETCTESPFPKATSTSLISFWHRISWSYTGCVVRPTLHYGIKFHKLLAFLNQRNDYIR